MLAVLLCCLQTVMQILRAGQKMELQVKARDMNEIRKVSMLLDKFVTHSALVITYWCMC
jgi:hypothetical protein